MLSIYRSTVILTGENKARALMINVERQKEEEEGRGDEGSEWRNDKLHKDADLDEW